MWSPGERRTTYTHKSTVTAACKKKGTRKTSKRSCRYTAANVLRCGCTAVAGGLGGFFHSCTALLCLYDGTHTQAHIIDKETRDDIKHSCSWLSRSEKREAWLLLCRGCHYITGSKELGRADSSRVKTNIYQVPLTGFPSLCVAQPGGMQNRLKKSQFARLWTPKPRVTAEPRPGPRCAPYVYSPPPCLPRS